MRIKCALIIICIHLDPAVKPRDDKGFKFVIFTMRCLRQNRHDLGPAVIRLRFAAPRQEPRDDNVFFGGEQVQG